jgi:hypothetical protein
MTRLEHERTANGALAHASNNWCSLQCLDVACELCKARWQVGDLSLKRRNQGIKMKFTFFKPVLAVGVTLLVVGCASGSKDIRASYVSPMTYETYTCQQLVTENERLQRELTSVGGDVDKKAHGDKVKMGVGLVLFWPTLLFLKGDGVEAQEYARLKGEHEAFEQAYVKKSCSSVIAAQGSGEPAPNTAAAKQK